MVNGHIVKDQTNLNRWNMHKYIYKKTIYKQQI